MSAVRSGRRIGILLHGRKVWISELASITFVAALSAVLLVLSGCIIRNEYAIYRDTRNIASGKSDRIVLTHYLKQLRKRVAITELLCSITGGKIPAEMLFELSEIVLTNSNQFGYDPHLLLAVIEVESYYLPTARGKYRSGAESGAFGLMQLKPETAREIAAQLDMDSLSQADLFKPEVNVVLGVAYLTSMISRFKNFKLGLLAYNQGPAVVSRQLSQKQPLSIGYYQKVLRSYYALKQHSLRLAAAKGETPLCR